MRHSTRLDKEGWKKAPVEKWPDKDTRPYDPPIIDFDMPVKSALLLKEYRIGVIVSSPFRRCLQTAGVVARTLGINTVNVDDRLGEWFREVERCCSYAGLHPQPFRDLPEEEMQTMLGDEVKLGTWKRSVIGYNDTEGLCVCSFRELCECRTGTMAHPHPHPHPHPPTPHSIQHNRNVCRAPFLS